MPLLEDVLKGGGAAPRMHLEPRWIWGERRILEKSSCCGNKVARSSVSYFGSGSEEGKRIERALKSISPIHKDIKAEDIAATFQMIQSALGLGGNPLGGIGGGVPPVPGVPGAGAPMGGPPGQPGMSGMSGGLGGEMASPAGAGGVDLESMLRR